MRGEDFKKVKRVPEAPGTDWKTPKKIGRGLKTRRALVGSVPQWPVSTLDGHVERHVCEGNGVVACLRGYMRGEGGLFENV